MPSTAETTVKYGHIVHHIPGRLRIRVLDAQESSEFFKDINKTISAIPGVTLVQSNKYSSSLVVNYTTPDDNFQNRLRDHPSVRIWLSLVDAGTEELFSEKKSENYFVYTENHSRIAESIVSVAEQLDVGLLQASNGFLDFKVLIPIGVAIATSLNRARGRGTPMWISLGTFAFNSFLTFHHRRINTPRQHGRSRASGRT